MDGTKREILPALIAAEETGVFQRSAIHPYYLKKAAYNSDRPFENTAWGTPPKGKRPDNAGDYRALQKRAKELGIGKKCWGMKEPELRKAIEEYAQSQSGPGPDNRDEGLPGQDGEVAQAPHDLPAGEVEASPEASER